jgi:hypothetical protein
LEHFRCNDVRNQLIICYRDNWEDHAKKHPEIREQESAVIATLQSPMAIYQDARSLDSQVYYRPNILPSPNERNYLRIVVKFHKPLLGAMRGIFVTAFAVVPLSIPRTGEVILWPQT